VLGLIALFSSYDHITLAGRTLKLQQQWGIPFIAASLATVFTGCVQYGAPLGRDAQLATRSRLRAAQDALRAAQDAARAENEAARERDRAAEARERQREIFKRLDQAALLSGRFQLDPTPTNRARFQFFLTLIADVSSPDL
jgi:outer membrane murein-binding lipoprotein Lpp